MLNAPLTPWVFKVCDAKAYIESWNFVEPCRANCVRMMSKGYVAAVADVPRNEEWTSEGQRE